MFRLKLIKLTNSFTILQFLRGSLRRQSAVRKALVLISYRCRVSISENVYFDIKSRRATFWGWNNSRLIHIGIRSLGWRWLSFDACRERFQLMGGSQWRSEHRICFYPKRGTGWTLKIRSPSAAEACRFPALEILYRTFSTCRHRSSEIRESFSFGGNYFYLIRNWKRTSRRLSCFRRYRFHIINTQVGVVSENSKYVTVI